METLINNFITNTPKLVSGVGQFINDVAPLLIELNEKIDEPAYAEKRVPLMQKMVKSTFVMLDLMLSHFMEFSDYHSMSATGPWNGIMALFTTMAYFNGIVEDRVSNKSKPWQMWASAKTLPFLIKNRVVISDDMIKSYTHEHMHMALHVLAVRWYRMEIAHPDLEKYLLALIHRQCILLVSEDKEIDTILKCADGVPRDDKERENDVFRMMTMRCRRCMQLIRMYYLVKFPSRFTVKTESRVRNPDSINRLRIYTSEMIKILSKSRDAKSELRTVFPKLILLHGDVEAFINARGMENARPVSLLMTVRPEAQQAIAQLDQFLILQKVADNMRDDDPLYFDKFTRYEHAYLITLKTYVINMVLKKHDIDFFRDYIVYELDIPYFCNEFTRKNEPVLIQLFGRIHVYFSNHIYMCNCIDAAIVTWIDIVLNELGGRLCRRDLTETLQHLLGGQFSNQTDMPIFGSTALVSKGKIIID